MAGSRLTGRSLSVAPVQRRHISRARQPVRASAIDLLASQPSGTGIMIQAASALAWAAVLGFGANLFLKQQSEPEDAPRSECSACSGTGYVECWCSRWSDGDAGCGTCRGSGSMVCQSCRGGGTAVPIEARLIIRKDDRTSNFRQFK